MSEEWVIRKNGFFYRPDRKGYTRCIHEAGVYTEAEAKAEASIEPDCVSAHPRSEFLMEFAGLTPKSYKVILADPPWRFATHSDKGRLKCADQHYDCMSLEDIKALPVSDLAHPDGCLLVMWSTWSQVATGSHTDVMRAWGFEPSSGGSWLKVTVNAMPAFGTGYVLRDACEPFFTAKRGRIPVGLRRTERNAIFGPLREHSRKPDEMHEMLDRLAPGLPKCELFARRPWGDWDCWGNELW